eukprot:2471364-Rhodomonas_salina.1
MERRAYEEQTAAQLEAEARRCAVPVLDPKPLSYLASQRNKHNQIRCSRRGSSQGAREGRGRCSRVGRSWVPQIVGK